MAKKKQRAELVVATRTTPMECKLPRNKALVLEVLSAGKSLTETAAVCRVGRRTIYDWLRYDPVFRAAYNHWKNSVEESVRRQLIELTEVAVATLRQSIVQGDGKLAIELLTRCKAFPKPEDRPVTVTETRDEISIMNTGRRMKEQIAALKLGAEKGIAAISYTDAEARQLTQHFQTVPALASPDDLWTRGMLLGQACRSTGVSIGLIDLLIATIAIHHGAELVTFEEDFRNIARASDLHVKVLKHSAV
jgi:predicted nucleic acid-binding protein